MNSSFRRTLVVSMGIALALGLSSTAFAQGSVLSSVAVRVNPGQMDKYLGEVRKLQAAMDRLEAGARAEVWQVTVGGPTAGTTFVVLEYPSLGAYAQATSKSEGDAEFQKLLGGLDSLRTVESSSLYRQLSGPGSAGDVAKGSILQTVFVRVNPGRLDDYLARVEKLRKIAERLGATSAMRVWQATAAGEATGNVVVGLVYPDLATYAADTTKIQGDAEWQKTVAGLDDIRTLLSIGLARNVGP